MTTQSPLPGLPGVIHKPPAEESNRYALTRMVLIDSLSSGRIVDMPVDDGAVLTGRNGAGKTSMLQLLPVFYGESPNRIVTQEAGRQSFVGYYLPRDTSYIVFEYERHGEKRQVAVHSDRNGEKVIYRFIRHGFEPRQFVVPDGELVRAHGLVKHLKMQGFQCCEQQIESLSEYRAIIQAIPSATRDRQRQRYLRELTADYSVTPTNRPLPQIEKIVAGMFRRKTNFDDLQGIVVECVADQGSTLSVSGDRRKIEDWPRHYRAYTEVMTMAPTMAAVALADSHLCAAEVSMGEVKAKCMSLLTHLDLRIHATSGELRSHQAALVQETEGFTARAGELRGKQQAATNDAGFAEARARDLEQQHADFERQELKKKEALVARSQQLRDELGQLEERRRALLGEQSEISNSYDRMKQVEKDNFRTQKDAAQQRLRQLRDQYDLALDQLSKAQQEEEERAGAVHDARRPELDQEVQDASANQGRWQHAASHPAPDPAASQALQDKQDALDKLRGERDALDRQRRGLEAAYHKAQGAFHDQEAQKAAAARQVLIAQDELTNVQRLYMPEDGTLLQFLRSEHPRWVFDIAKVVREDILTRSDLSPIMEESSGTLFGLTLDLEKLDAYSLADQEAAQQAMDLAEKRLTEAKAAVTAATDALVERGREREAAEQAFKAHEQKVFTQNSRIQAAEAEVASAKRLVETSWNDAAKLAQQKLEEARIALAAARRRLTDFDALRRAEAVARLAECNRQRNELLAKRSHDQKAIDAEVAGLDAALQGRLRQLDAERDEVLRKKGVDTTQINSIETQRTAITKDLQTIKNVIELVQQYRHWLRNEWPAHPKWLEKARQSRAIEREHAQQVAELEAKWDHRRKQLATATKDAEQRLQALTRERQVTQHRIDKLQAYPDAEIPVYDPTWTLDALVGLANLYAEQERTQRAEIRKQIAELHRGFGAHLGTPPDQYLQSYRGSISSTDERDWIEPFGKWFAGAHLEYQRILLTEAITIAGDVQAFHRTLDDFHRRVNQFNRELQSYLDTNLAFDSIAKVGVEVVSTIKELNYWAAICDMAEAHRAWLNGASTDLPPAEFVQTIERLLEHWEAKAGIRADLKHLIRIQGEVIENGNRRVFKKASDLEAVSSNGLSYLVLVSIFIAFINRIRRDAAVNIVWSLDELKDLDSGNVNQLLALLKRNDITLVSAFPDPDTDTLALFKHRFTVEPDRRLAEVWIDEGDRAQENVDSNEATNV
ncbi:ATP-binding protein [Massilia brevitalea]|uniref:ATP-binding protein n=1 Tax=Massilia brevitalea TaxID=442526 RepID=UPI002803DA88|nr:ATP-binding protein [Massilia brevitalea]